MPTYAQNNLLRIGGGGLRPTGGVGMDDVTERKGSMFYFSSLGKPTRTATRGAVMELVGFSFKNRRGKERGYPAAYSRILIAEIENPTSNGGVEVGFHGEFHIERRHLTLIV